MGLTQFFFTWHGYLWGFDPLNPHKRFTQSKRESIAYFHFSKPKEDQIRERGREGSNRMQMMCLKNVSMIFVLWETRGQGSRWREWSTIPRAGPAQIITTVKVTRVGIRSKPVSWFFMVCIPHKAPNVNAICNPMHKM